MHITLILTYLDSDFSTTYKTLHFFFHFLSYVCVEEARPPSTVSEKPDVPSPSPQSERRSWSSSPSHSIYGSRTHRKQHPDHLRRTSTASGKTQSTDAAIWGLCVCVFHRKAKLSQVCDG